AQGVDREQYDAGADRLGGAGVDQDRGQDRSDARRPAGRERHAHQHRSQNAERLRGELLLALAGERGNGEYAGEEDSEQDDEHARRKGGDARDLVDLRPEHGGRQLASRGWIACSNVSGGMTPMNFFTIRPRRSRMNVVGMPAMPPYRSVRASASSRTG